MIVFGGDVVDRVSIIRTGEINVNYEFRNEGEIETIIKKLNG